MAGGGKKEKGEGLGRALIRQRNKAAAAAKERGEALAFGRRRGAMPLESVIDVSDIDAVLQRAAEADQLAEAASVSSDSDLVIDLDATGETEEVRRRLRMEQEALHASSLRVPRRPPWHSQMTVEELDANERRAFLVWRRNLARLEENDKLVLTPFEKNIDIWRQLWRVLERSDLLVMVVDARDPLFYRCPDLEAYAKEIDEHKRTMLLVNKADLLPLNIRKRWADYFKANDIPYVFWSAQAATATLEGKKLSGYSEEESASLDLDTKIYGRDELLMELQAEAESIVAQRRTSTSVDDQEASSSDSVSSVAKHVVVGFVGYPNVGKTSTINALIGEKRTGVTHTPGKIKLVIYDSPGQFLPSFSVSCYGLLLQEGISFEELATHKLCWEANSFLHTVEVSRAKMSRSLVEMTRMLKSVAEDIRVWLQSMSEVKILIKLYLMVAKEIACLNVGLNEVTALLKDLICNFESINEKIMSKKSQTREINGQQVKVFEDCHMDAFITANLWIIKELESLLAKLLLRKVDCIASLVDDVKELQKHIQCYKTTLKKLVKSLKEPREHKFVLPPTTLRIVECLEVINKHFSPGCAPTDLNVATFTPAARKFHKIVMAIRRHGVKSVREVNTLFKSYSM